jgi:hypothetical protein
MSKSMYCPNCGAYVGNCGHVSGGFAGPSTLSGTCVKCERQYSVTCNCDCLKEKVGAKQGSFTSGLRLSEDGRAILDNNGEELATFREGTVVRIADKGGELRLPGQMVCTKECIAWDSNGNCVKYVQSCTWEFPPLD